MQTQAQAGKGRGGKAPSLPASKQVQALDARYRTAKKYWATLTFEQRQQHLETPLLGVLTSAWQPASCYLR